MDLSGGQPHVVPDRFTYVNSGTLNRQYLEYKAWTSNEQCLDWLTALLCVQAPCLSPPSIEPFSMLFSCFSPIKQLILRNQLCEFLALLFGRRLGYISAGAATIYSLSCSTHTYARVFCRERLGSTVEARRASGLSNKHFRY